MILLVVRLKWRKVDVIGQLVLSVIFGRSIDFICDVVVDIWRGILFQRSELAFQRLSLIAGIIALHSETLVSIMNNGPSQDFSHIVTPGCKPFVVFVLFSLSLLR